MRFLLLATLLGLALLALAPQAEALERLHSYYELRDDTEALAAQYPDIAIYSEHGSSTGPLGLAIFSVDVALNITTLPEAELAALPTMYVDGAHHGNEGMASEAAFLFLQDVLERSTADPAYLTGKRLVVTPIMNTDGHLQDCRNNWNGVDLNRNYPWMWGLYGTSDTRGSCPASGTYRGPSAGSEGETQDNMALMRSLNLYAYLSGHTGSNDIVLPWKTPYESPDHEYAKVIADWTLYQRFLNESTNVSGLSYRDPSGAGESIAWGYGARGAVSVIVEVTTQQWSPIEDSTLRQELANELLMYDMAWENLLKLGGRPVVIGTGPGELTVRNDGWGAAYNLSAGGIILPRLEPGETATVDWHDSQLRYERILRNPERDVDADGVVTLEVGTPLPDIPNQPVPAVSPLAVFAVLGLAARSRIIRA